jgi:hypothetical protein
MANLLHEIIELDRYPLDDDTDDRGVLVLPEFLRPAAIACISKEGAENQHLAYYTTDSHNIYLMPSDPAFPDSHPRNRQVTSSKGCITTDQIPDDSMLHTLYDATEFREFMSARAKDRSWAGITTILPLLSHC